MKLKTRRRLYIIFIFIFIVTTPIVCAYAAGYKINLTWPPNLSKIFVKTGMLIVETKPKGALIYLNQKLKKQNLFNSQVAKTPTKVKNLIPKEYKVSLELDNYWPYIERIKIYPGKTSFLKNIKLFKKNNLEKISTSSSDFFPEENTLNKQNDLLKIKENILEISSSSKEILDYLNKDDFLYLLFQDKLKIYKNHNLLGEIKFPISYDYRFINPKNQFLNIYDAKHEILYLINPNSQDPIKEILHNIKYTSWVDEKNLIYASDYEIWKINLEQNQKNIITRISKKIKNIFHYAPDYLIYATQNEINILKISNQNTLKILEKENISDVSLDLENNTIYFSENVLNKTFYKLEI